MHVISGSLPIVVEDEDGTRARVDIPPDVMIVHGNENVYHICLSTVG